MDKKIFYGQKVSENKWYGKMKLKSVFGSDKINCLRHRIGEEVHPGIIQARANNPKRCMIPTCTSANAVAHLYVIYRKLKSKTPSYNQNFLLLSEISFQKMPHLFTKKFHLTTTLHRFVKRWFTKNDIQVLEWPGNRPDQNHIEHLWCRLNKSSTAQPSIH